MMYTKGQRKRAALICAIAASNPDLDQAYELVMHAAGMKVSHGITLNPIEDLAYRAWGVASKMGVYHPDAEAEAMIQTGWTP